MSALGRTAFQVLFWGDLLLVVAVLAYVAYGLVQGWQEGGGGERR